MQLLLELPEATEKPPPPCLHYHLLKNGGLNVGMAGNVGQSFAKQVAETNVRSLCAGA